MAEKFKVLHFSTSDQEGGSARSAWRIHSGLKKLDVGSKMLVAAKSSTSADVETVSGGGWLQKLDIYTNIFLQKIGRQYQFVPSQSKMMGHRWVKDCDIVQLFNIHGGYFNPECLRGLAKGAKLVWRLSDLWPMTGHCAYPGPCEKWKSGCGGCPDLETYPPIKVDRTQELWQQKFDILQDIDLTVVAPSSWSYDAAKDSPMLAGKDIRLIHNGIDLSNYQAMDKAQARRELGISGDKTVLFFGAHVAFDNPRKGTDILLDALNQLKNPDKFLFLTAGHQSEHWQGAIPCEVVSLGYLDQETDIIRANGAADFILAPSMVENLPNTIIEALAMSKPVIAFDSGGIKDAVIEGETGILVKDRTARALAAKLDGLIESPQNITLLSQNARKLAEAKFDEQKEVLSFKALYEELLQP